MSKAAGRVKSSFQNAYTFYTSAVIWEAMGDINAALVDYKKALEINPDNTTITKDIERLNANNTIKHSSNGHLVVLFEDGFAPVQTNRFQALPLGQFAVSRNGARAVGELAEGLALASVGGEAVDAGAFFQ